MNKGHRRVLRAPPRPGSAGASRLPRPVDPATEVLVLNGSREGLFLAAHRGQALGQRPTPARPAILMPNPFYAAYAAGAVAADCEPVYLPATARDRLPARSRCALRRAARAHRRLLSRLARQPAGRGREPGLSRAARRAGAPLRLPGVQRRMLLGDLHPGSRRPACWKPPGPTSRTWSCSSRCRSARTCPGCASASPPATASSSRASSNCATSSSPQVPVPAQRGRDRRLWRRGARRGEPRGSTSQKFDLADQIIGDRYGYRRPAGGFLLWLDVSRAWRRRGGDAAALARSRPARHSRQLSRARAGRRLAIPARAISASPWCRTRRPRPRRCIASSRCWAEERSDHVGDRPRPRQPRASLRRPARGAAPAAARARRRRADRARDAAGASRSPPGRCRTHR